MGKRPELSIRPGRYFSSEAMTHRRRIEIATLGSLAGIFVILPVYAPQGVDVFAVAFFLLGSLLIDKSDIEASDWTGRRPFVFACAALILAIPFVSGACSANGFKAEVGSGVYIAAAPAALFLVASRARFHLVGPEAIGRLILAAIFAGLIPATIYGLMVTATPPARFYLPGQPALNIAAVYMSCMSVITLNLTANLGRRLRMVGYVAVLALLMLGLLTASRTFIVSTAVILAVYVFTMRHRKTLLREMMALIGIVLAFTAASLFAFRGSLARLFESQQYGFFDGRLQTWSDGLELFRRYPLCGIGPHTFFNVALNPLYVERAQKGIPFDAFYHAHNVYLNTLAEGGVILGVLLVVMIAAAIYGCTTILRANPENPFGLIALAMLVMFLVIGLFENTMVRPLLFMLAIFLGLGMNVTWRGRPAAISPTAATGQGRR